MLVIVLESLWVTSRGAIAPNPHPTVVSFCVWDYLMRTLLCVAFQFLFFRFLEVFLLILMLSLIGMQLSAPLQQGLYFLLDSLWPGLWRYSFLQLGFSSLHLGITMFDSRGELRTLWFNEVNESPSCGSEAAGFTFSGDPLCLLFAVHWRELFCFLVINSPLRSQNLFGNH